MRSGRHRCGTSRCLLAMDRIHELSHVEQQWLSPVAPKTKQINAKRSSTSSSSLLVELIGHREQSSKRSGTRLVSWPSGKCLCIVLKPVSVLSTPRPRNVRRRFYVYYR